MLGLREGSQLVARRELRLLLRGRQVVAGLGVMAATAWTPVLLIPLRSGIVGLAPLDQALPLTLALGGVVLPLLALLSGTDALASELEAGTLISIVTLPISRSACFLGKASGLFLTTCLLWLGSYGSAFVAMLAAHGREGAGDYLAVALTALLLTLSCGGIGLALGSSASGETANGRLRALASALGMWLLLVLVVDAVLLGLLVAATPAPPEVGGHGHTELQAPRAGATRATAASTGSDGEPMKAEPAGFSVSSLFSGKTAWLMASTPVDLYRLTGLSVSRPPRDSTRPRPIGEPVPPWLQIVVGWSFWLLGPFALALFRFRQAALR